jgi:hypothetical protein
MTRKKEENIMSNELNLREVANGTIDPGVTLFNYFILGDYASEHKKHRFFTIGPDPSLPFDGGTVTFGPSVVNLEITRTWSTVWVSPDASTLTFQNNIEWTNIGDTPSAYHILLAETDN